MKQKISSLRTVDIAYIGLFVSVMAICSWISIPTAVPFTLQTFAVFLAVGLLGGKRGTLCVITYVIIGAIGFPVFSGFTGGFGVLLSQNGGFLIGFIVSALIMWWITSHFGKSIRVLAISMIVGLLVCYAFGCAWFYLFYISHTGPVGLVTILGWCVLPFIIPDLCKIALALFLTKRLHHVIHAEEDY